MPEKLKYGILKNFLNSQPRNEEVWLIESSDKKKISYERIAYGLRPSGDRWGHFKELQEQFKKVDEFEFIRMSVIDSGGALYIFHFMRKLSINNLDHIEIY